MKPDFYIFIEYKSSTDDVRIASNIKNEHVEEMIGDYLRAQIGAGSDDSTPRIGDVYQIKLFLELTEDTWASEHDCGNKGLREGILMQVMRLFRAHPEKISWIGIESFQSAVSR